MSRRSPKILSHQRERDSSKRRSAGQHTWILADDRLKDKQKQNEDQEKDEYKRRGLPSREKDEYKRRGSPSREKDEYKRERSPSREKDEHRRRSSSPKMLSSWDRKYGIIQAIPPGGRAWTAWTRYDMPPPYEVLGPKCSNPQIDWYWHQYCGPCPPSTSTIDCSAILVKNPGSDEVWFNTQWEPQ